ncbi:MAG: epoxyqueuosine reductase [Proteobacteria bacterium]|nr:epoxyqueuosine reductase [Pseudomonadota bacterium]
MDNKKILSASSAILRKAKKLGAPLAGFANVKDLKIAPSFTFAPQMPVTGKEINIRESEMALDPGEVHWPEHAKSVLVVAVEHPKEKPEMDWWFGLISPPGNKILIKIVKGLCEWIPEIFNIEVFHFPYHIEHGGIYLKDAAVMAGLGCIGRNNLLVTPDFGPRIRLRAMALNVPMPSTGPTAFDPCGMCGDLCRKTCPQKAFDKKLYSSEVYDQTILPARDGVYARSTCNRQMQKNIDSARNETAEGLEKPVKIIKYCRNCEMSCPVGKI